MADAAVTPVATFRIPFWRMYLPTLVFAQMCFAVGLWGTLFLLSASSGRPLASAMVVGHVIGSVLMVVCVAAVVAQHVRKKPVTLTPDGLTCSNGFFKRVTVPWGAITRVRRLTLPGFPYLLVSTTGSRLPLWLPLFLDRMEEFADTVAEYAGPDHLLYPHVWRRAEAG